MYRCEATSLAGFVQQIAVSYVANGYYFYVLGRVPDRKDPRAQPARKDPPVQPAQQDLRGRRGKMAGMGRT